MLEALRAGMQCEVAAAGSQAGRRAVGSANLVHAEETMAGIVEGKVVVVTGAGGGIGREIAVMMAGEGAKVVINDIGVSVTGDGGSSTPAEQTKAIIEQRGGQAVINTESVSSWNSAKRIIQCALDTYGRIDGVVNNAGILRDVIFHKMTEDDWNSVINVHLSGAFYTSRAAAEFYRKQESGTFVHMSSTSGLIGNFGQANYAAAKLGITALSKSIALDMMRYNVRSNCISPFAWSRMTGSIPVNTPEQKARLEKIQQMTPDKNAPMAVYLTSDRAAGVSGQVFATRHNEIFLMSSSRPVRGVHHDGGWTPTEVGDIAIPALKGSFMPLDRSGEVFTWDPV
jgi:NAD(P)-dependent dehydrogenase (short-subunit alcohol dehydrogenase family)